MKKNVIEVIVDLVAILALHSTRPRNFKIPKLGLKSLISLRKMYLQLCIITQSVVVNALYLIVASIAILRFENRHFLYKNSNFA